MYSLACMDVSDIKDKVEQMSKNYHVEIARILITKYNVAYDENQNGIFINLSQLSPEVHKTISQFINYVDLQEKQLRDDENEKDGLKDIFFKKE
jgi:hypothetical protein